MSRPGEGPPGNSLERDQRSRVAAPGDDLATGLAALLRRVREELAYNDAKGARTRSGPDGDLPPYRLGMHDGLRFAEDAIVDLLRGHGHEVAESAGTPIDT